MGIVTIRLGLPCSLVTWEIIGVVGEVEGGEWGKREEDEMEAKV